VEELAVEELAVVGGQQVGETTGHMDFYGRLTFLFPRVKLTGGGSGANGGPGIAWYMNQQFYGAGGGGGYSIYGGETSSRLQ
jgi:hypothetical protein